jgi:soluble lytic murein transglycosylase-like protein
MAINKKGFLPEEYFLALVLLAGFFNLGSHMWDHYGFAHRQDNSAELKGLNVSKVKEELLGQAKLWKLKIPPKFDFDLFTRSLLEAQFKFGIDYQVLFAVAVVESGFHVNAVSYKGAQGVFQFMPQTAEIVWPKTVAFLSESDPLRRLSPSEAVGDVRASTLMGAFYIADLKRLFSGRLHLALASYNVGPAALKRGLDEGKLLSSEYVFRVFDLANELKGYHRTPQT